MNTLIETLEKAIRIMENTQLGDKALGLSPSILLEDAINSCKEELKKLNNGE